MWLKKGWGDSLEREKCSRARDKGHVKVYHKVDSFVGLKRSIRTRSKEEWPWVYRQYHKHFPGEITEEAVFWSRRR